jgi:hypothetical protein
MIVEMSSEIASKQAIKLLDLLKDEKTWYSATLSRSSDNVKRIKLCVDIDDVGYFVKMLEPLVFCGIDDCGIIILPRKEYLRMECTTTDVINNGEIIR